MAVVLAVEFEGRLRVTYPSSRQAQSGSEAKIEHSHLVDESITIASGDCGVGFESGSPEEGSLPAVM